jgi:hypothetical protein
VLDGRLVGAGSTTADADVEAITPATPAVSRAQVSAALRESLEAAVFAGETLFSAVAAAEDRVTKRFKVETFADLGLGACSRFLSDAAHDESEGASSAGELSLGQVLEMLGRGAGDGARASDLMNFVAACCHSLDGEDLNASIECLKTPVGLACLERAVVQHFGADLAELGCSWLRPLIARLNSDTVVSEQSGPTPLAALLLSGAIRQAEIESGVGNVQPDVDARADATQGALGELDTACAVRALSHAPLLADLEEATQWQQVPSTLCLLQPYPYSISLYPRYSRSRRARSLPFLLCTLIVSRCDLDPPNSPRLET